MIPLFAIGDCHGGFTKPSPIMAQMGQRCQLNMILPKLAGNTVQIGDYGIFDGKDVQTLRKLRPRDGYEDWFFRGNHDNPELCNAQSNYLGDFGVLPGYPDIMFFAGAESVDVAPNPANGWPGRTEGKNWWRNEQLSDDQMQQAFDLYEQVKPRIVLSHECPSRCYGVLSFSGGFNIWKSAQNRTAAFLDNLVALHKPEIWVHGHHHQSRGYFMDGIKFRCLNELEVYPVAGQNLDE